jgi:hypothetical protein
MSALAYGDYLPDVPCDATWWRQRLYAGPDGNQYVMQIDNTDAPTQVTITWWDGGVDETIEPYAMFILEDERWPDIEPYSSVRSVYAVEPPPRKFLDVLYVGVPTGGEPPQLQGGGYCGKWEQLTGYGSHVHPRDRDKVREMRKELLYSLWHTKRGTFR